MVQNYRRLVHFIIQIIQSLQFITESLDFFKLPFHVQQINTVPQSEPLRYT